MIRNEIDILTNQLIANQQELIDQLHCYDEYQTFFQKKYQTETKTNRFE